MSRNIGWIVAVLVLFLDQLAKWFISGPLQLPFEIGRAHV